METVLLEIIFYKNISSKLGQKHAGCCNQNSFWKKDNVNFRPILKSIDQVLTV